MANIQFARFLGPGPSVPDRLEDITGFGSNPGKLRARIYTPQIVSRRPALVVALHGCTQTAATYDEGSGWSTLADEQGFILLFPEQQRSNNPNLCFNWFTPEDTRRGKGEALSIQQMVVSLIRDRDVDPDRVFITGLSAGGAMTSVMLATYPELFVGGAIIAGLPYGTAAGVPKALERMTGQNMPDAAALEVLVRNASSHSGPWPTVSIWHGTADATVNIANAKAILAQWRSVHAIADACDATDILDGFPHRTWRDAKGRVAIEYYEVKGMGHGVPLQSDSDNPCGVPTPFFLDVGISSTRRIATYWGLVETHSKRKARVDHLGGPAGPQPMSDVKLPVLRNVRPERIYSQTPKPEPAKGVGKIIEDALRAAGLMK